MHLCIVLELENSSLDSRESGERSRADFFSFCFTLFLIMADLVCKIICCVGKMSKAAAVHKMKADAIEECIERQEYLKRNPWDRESPMDGNVEALKAQLYPPPEPDATLKYCAKLCCILNPVCGCVLCWMVQARASERRAKEEREAARQELAFREMKQRHTAERSASVREWEVTPVVYSVSFPSATSGNTLTFSVDESKRMRLSR